MPGEASQAKQDRLEAVGMDRDGGGLGLPDRTSSRDGGRHHPIRMEKKHKRPELSLILG